MSTLSLRSYESDHTVTVVVPSMLDDFVEIYATLTFALLLELHETCTSSIALSTPSSGHDIFISPTHFFFEHPSPR